MSFYFTDTHTHLYSKEFQHDLPALLQKAIHNNVSKFYLPNIDSDSIDIMLQVEQQWPNHCFAMMGLHPTSVDETVAAQLKTVREWLDKRPFFAVGEIGIDLYWDKTHFEAQKHAFNTQLDWAIEFGYAVSIHCRNAFDELYDIMKSRSALPNAVFHCFSGTTEQAQKVLDLGTFKLGIGGVLTFKNGGLDQVVRDLALEHFVLETDGPYLAPLPFRGKRNEPAYLLEIAKKMAEIKGISMQELAETTSASAEYIFRKR